MTGTNTGTNSSLGGAPARNDGVVGSLSGVPFRGGHGSGRIRCGSRARSGGVLSHSDGMARRVGARVRFVHVRLHHDLSTVARPVVDAGVKGF